MFNSEDLETTLVKKDMEWKELQSLHIKQLEAALKEATTELGDQRKQFQCLQEDFQFNLKLLKERDHTLECYDAVVSTFQANDCTRQREVSELHLHINKLQDAVRQGKRQCTALQTTHQQKMAELHLHLTTLCREKNEEIQKLKEENESLKSSIRLRIEEAEGTLVLQKQEMMAKFDAEMKKQEHEFNLRIKDMSSEVLSHKLKVELMKKELEVHTRGHSEAMQALQASEDQCYQAHEEIKQRDLVLTNTISMKDTRIQELMDQLRQTEDKHEREEEKARRKFAMLDSNYRERETALAEMRDIHAKRLCEAETRRRDLQTQLNVLLDEQTMRDKSHNRQLQQKDQEILELRRELESTRCSWDTYITKMSKDMVVKDTELLTAREQETKLKTELDRYIEDVKRYKQQLVSGLNREQSLEQRLVQLELDWKKRCENVWAEDYVKDKELIEGFTLSRDKLMAALHDKDKELEEMRVLLNTVRIQRDQALQGKPPNNPQGDSQQTPDHSSPSSEICELQKQNASLCAVVAEMRKEMETLAREIPVVATVRQTEDKKIQTEIKALLLNLQPGAQAASASAAVPPALSPAVSPPQLSPVGGPLEKDVLYTRASESLALDKALGEGIDEDSRSSHADSHGASRSTPGGSEASLMSVRPTIKMALARLGLDPTPSMVVPQSAFFKRTSPTEAFCVPPSAPYIEELQRCWVDPRHL
ncbi:hypothetical protein ACEWY4_025604 [Coilia grayii]|uniref:Coiled-coil domain-containing protein 57 n=1 Tax=Coilia grayii TaxID=363190 RepID=A0ABD1ITG7_9TELE